MKPLGHAANQTSTAAHETPQVVVSPPVMELHKAKSLGMASVVVTWEVNILQTTKMLQKRRGVKSHACHDGDLKLDAEFIPRQLQGQVAGMQGCLGKNGGWKKLHLLITNTMQTCFHLFAFVAQER